MKLAAVLAALISTLCVADVTASSAEPLKFGVAAMISPQETVKYYRQIIEYVGKRLGRPVEMVQKQNYDETDRLLEKGELKMAFVCSGPYVMDKEKFGVELLVAPQSYGEPFYYAYIIAHKSSNVTDLAQLKGKSFAFTDPKSNTGKIVPTYMIGKRFNLPPEKFFGRIIYTKTHDKAIEAVAKKIVDGASVDSLIYNYAASKDPRFTSQTKIIARSPRYGIPPIVTRKDIDPALKARVRDIFLNMHKDPEGKAILSAIKIDRFIVPRDADYDSVREMEKWLRMNIK
ncbi:phosphate/phosphite/phosphonate ABC transporter substrate-binding protein [Geomonas sp. Red69]|uniref:Phosphate/phosphite/phosphonate ABC transporter substrate-binding protein n=1 Tax=Geomonas diazotrophica TaxID=2843197 RepID=A0ABX8JCQ5_9BACT|nr:MULTISPECIES: phosphate/phosphite/phosphonate ABC transporter substrate-binding protein [Geomonas]MBU5637664.1 phosphate/phosphite/phosphonate ABC transporter substrate-binding protein [Geomonas diazotrophica]QWV96203.1 phosphate/phosphite/phosphonate ABC transporter substrate-binding protein [Geomonas nitrogeniifigens]QXE85270.1 phosphate/phosphite/phosphonate ABC transporter substrate-binding protein [Geomonas nitrogeniifigens]